MQNSKLLLDALIDFIQSNLQEINIQDIDSNEWTRFDLTELGLILFEHKTIPNHFKVFDKNGKAISLYESKGYVCVTSEPNFNLHRLVYLAHNPDSWDKFYGIEFVIDHINNIGLDNRIENLQLVTNVFNSSKHKRPTNDWENCETFYLNEEAIAERLNGKQKKEITSMREVSFITTKELAPRVAHRLLYLSGGLVEVTGFLVKTKLSSQKGKFVDEEKEKVREQGREIMDWARKELKGKLKGKKLRKAIEEEIARRGFTYTLPWRIHL